MGGVFGVGSNFGVGWCTPGQGVFGFYFSGVFARVGGVFVLRGDWGAGR